MTRLIVLLIGVFGVHPADAQVIGGLIGGIVTDKQGLCRASR